jgi:hypothetical protein
LLDGPARDGEEILFADLDLDEIVRGKFAFDGAAQLCPTGSVPIDG